MSNRLVSVDDLLTIDDIARHLNMSVACASNIVRRRDGCRFPKPIAGTYARGVWLWQDFEAWYDENADQLASARRKHGTFKQPSWTSGRKAG